jgi:dTDP-4-amino-4,6-dideoxygalactose transaminase
MKTIPLFKIHTPPNIGAKLQEIFDSGFISEGEHADRFESEFGNYVDNKNCSLVNSCTSALTLAYVASNVGIDDEVITTPMTCMATNEPIHTLGAKIVWADLDPRTGNIDPESVKKRITKKTKAIVGVHWAGQPFEIDEINTIAAEHGIKVIEDAAHALGAKYKEKLIGSHSDFVCFSFQAIKHLTTVDGGAITSKNIKDDLRIKKLKWFGLDRKYPHSKWTQDITEAGYKFHMNNINACIGLEQMKYIDNIVSKHKENYRFYNNNITNSKIIKMREEKHLESACWIYTILTKDREDLQKYLASKNIASDVVHVRNDKYSVFNEYRLSDDLLKGTNEFCSQHLNIPVGWWLTEQDRQYIVDVLNAY